MKISLCYKICSFYRYHKVRSPEVSFENIPECFLEDKVALIEYRRDRLLLFATLSEVGKFATIQSAISAPLRFPPNVVRHCSTRLIKLFGSEIRFRK